MHFSNLTTNGLGSKNFSRSRSPTSFEVEHDRELLTQHVSNGTFTIPRDRLEGLFRGDQKIRKPTRSEHTTPVTVEADTEAEYRRRSKSVPPEFLVTAVALSKDCSGSLKHTPSSDLDDHSSFPHDCLIERCQRITINVSGQRFETQLRTLERFPNTLLGDPNKRRKYWDPFRQEYFLDRHRPTFEAILNFYQSGGRLKRPMEVPQDIFMDEMTFYELGDEIVLDYKKKEGFMPEPDVVLPRHRILREIWLLMEFPSSSMYARVLGLFSIIVILVSIVTFCLETLPEFKDNSCINVTVVDKDGNTQTYAYKPNYRDPFFIIESCCVIWFTFELIIRLISCPNKKKFCLNIINIFDLLAILPYFVIVAVVSWLQSCSYDSKSASLAYLRILRLLRVTRIFKLSKHSRGLQVLGLTLKASMKELGMFAIFLGISVVLFASVMFFVETESKDTKFYSIPEGFWWAIVTMTTVGYGDLVPSGVWGKLVGTLCVIAGVLTIALPVPIVVNNFNNFYRHSPGRGGGGDGGLG
ncbi:potassium voltage-gated channel subfamily A member 7 [Lingula anatina]|uniref:Potassium voltage-gated channel subfamily A member 7 n=1 Tax=Lingula anatina TaxID=7574 RepID=A0A1S3JCC4_LINAN|nr:potassium voltage-gated channel subfamily A member 7 [Lingula anatina]|eukprot:XP_013408060.1 potassium voltage-gated channel subfamily A member 7 [Lingula anatina]